jgi:DNA polymerase V
MFIHEKERAGCQRKNTLSLPVAAMKGSSPPEAWAVGHLQGDQNFSRKNARGRFPCRRGVVDWSAMSTIVGKPVPFEGRTSLRIPLVSAKVEAGFPSPADDHLERSLDLNEHLVKNPAATFFVRVKGDSMRDAGISSEDILVVDRSVSPEDGQVVVAMLDGDFTVKRLRKRKGRVFLVAENNAYPPIEVGEDQELVVWGVVTFVIHQPR